MNRKEFIQGMFEYLSTKPAETWCKERLCDLQGRYCALGHIKEGTWPDHPASRVSLKAGPDFTASLIKANNKEGEPKDNTLNFLKAEYVRD